MDARSVRPPDARDDGAHSDRSEQSDVQRRAHDRRAALVSRRSPATPTVAARFNRGAERRRQALLAAAYEPADGYFYDVRWRTWRARDRSSDAGRGGGAVFRSGDAGAGGARSPTGSSANSSSRAVSSRRTIRSGQQWDAPNGWPPLEWLAIEGVRRYGGTDIANKGARSLARAQSSHVSSDGTMTEKYDVVDLSRRAGGGEYATQDGFGWTNGVALALSAEQRADKRAVPSTTERHRSGATIRDRSSVRREATSRR